MHYLVNTQKGLTVFFCAILLCLFRSTVSTPGFVYMGLHGGYGIVWLLKDLAIPDLRFRSMVSAGSAASRVELTARCSPAPRGILVHPLRHHRELPDTGSHA